MSQVNVRIRPLNENDLNDWFRMRKLLWDATTDDIHKTEMLEILEHPESQLILVADTDDGRLVGFLEASIRPYVEDCETDHVGYLEGWYVDPAFRRGGVGGRLVRTAERWAAERGCTEMASDAELGNDLSLAAHLALGYDESSRLVHLRKDL